MNNLTLLNDSCSFSDYFELQINPKELSQKFGYSFERAYLKLPLYAESLDSRYSETSDRIEEIRHYVDFCSEKARRDFLISPLLMDLIHYTKVEIQVEYSIKVNSQLQGIIDYFLESKRQIIVVEAKKADLDFGMTQLIAELIACDHYLEPEKQPEIIGTVTTGKSWEFARLDRVNKHIQQGLETYTLPNEFEQITRILVQALI